MRVPPQIPILPLTSWNACPPSFVQDFTSQGWGCGVCHPAWALFPGVTSSGPDPRRALEIHQKTPTHAKISPAQQRAPPRGRGQDRKERTGQDARSHHTQGQSERQTRTPRMASAAGSGPLRVCITGAAGQIAYSLLFSIAKGDVFGASQVTWSSARTVLVMGIAYGACPQS